MKKLLIINELIFEKVGGLDLVSVITLFAIKINLSYKLMQINPLTIPAKLRKAVAQRANHLCEYCKSPKAYSSGPFNSEHIIPLSLGGKSMLENLAYSCNECNGYKYNQIEVFDPVDEIDISLFNSRVEKWEEHFVWDENGVLIIGITPTGRATVETLRLNRIELINLSLNHS